MSENSTDVILLIHGTYAAAAEDEGNGWWQRGSAFWSYLCGRLISAKPYMDAAGRVFHSSGANSEYERQKAGEDLFWNWIRPLEDSKRPTT